MKPRETQNYNMSTEEDSQVEENDSAKKIRGLILRCFLYLIIVLICICIIPRFIVNRSIVDGVSMEPTLHADEHILVEKVSMTLNRLKRYDVIVFYPYGRDSKKYFIKRIIGMPGDTVWISDGTIYINDKPLNETFGSSPTTYEGIADEPLYINEDEYFVMGDNRSESFDSRYEQIGSVKKENIIGRAIFVVWPLKNFGTIE